MLGAIGGLVDGTTYPETLGISWFALFVGSNR